jgi:hypothetical protein
MAPIFVRCYSRNLLKPSENNYGNKVTSHTAELGNFLKDLKGTKGINVGARGKNEILRFGGRFYDGVLNLFPKKFK